MVEVNRQKGHAYLKNLQVTAADLFKYVCSFIDDQALENQKRVFQRTGKRSHEIISNINRWIERWR